MTDGGAEDTRQRIIDAALKLFGQVGYARASTRSIAEQAGVNEVTLFRHFGNKKTLLLACIQSGNQASFSQTFSRRLTGNYATDIRTMAYLQMEDTRQHVETLRLLLCDSQTVAELREALVLGAADNRKALADYFAQQIAQGHIRPGLDAMVLANAFDSLFSSYVLFAHLMGATPLPSITDDDVLNSLVSVFIHGTLAEKGSA